MKILVLAGGFDQIELINELKKRGNEVILADFFENPPAKQMADKHFIVSTLDEEAIYLLAREQNVDLITTACTDQALLTVAKVSERLKLPCYINAETARNVTNKVYMKEKFIEYDIPTAKCVTINENDTIIKPESKEYPLIVKPCDCNSSKGVLKVNNDMELSAAIKNAFLLSRSKNVIIESYIKGIEVSIDVWKDKIGAKILSVSETNKIKTNKDNFTIYQSKYPLNLSDEMLNKIQIIADKICAAFELENCPILIQAIIDEENIVVLEFSARMGGGSKYKLIEYMSEIPIMEVYVNRILGDEDQVIHPVWSNKKMELNYVYAENGILGELKNFIECYQAGEIKELFIYKTKGMKIEKKTTSSDRVAGFLIIENTEKELIKQRRNVLEKVDILNQQGDSIIYKECFY